MRNVSRMKRGARAGAVLAAALALLAACQPLPRPFAPTERGGDLPFSPAADAYGITLRPVSGMPSTLAVSFAPALVEALGLTVDEDTGGVTRADGTVIGGLYAAGRTALGVCSESNFSGLSIADTVFSGRRAARAALRLNEPAGLD